jgi:hypothetical protein
MRRVYLFLTGFLQVSLVSAQTWLISKDVFAGVFTVGFFISLVWSYNVKKIAFGGWWDRVAYAVGAGVGGVVGLSVVRMCVQSIR